MHGAADLAYCLLFALREQLLHCMGALLSHQSVLLTLYQRHARLLFSQWPKQHTVSRITILLL
jgi:hypothetical protein